MWLVFLAYDVTGADARLLRPFPPFILFRQTNFPFILILTFPHQFKFKVSTWSLVLYAQLLPLPLRLLGKTFCMIFWEFSLSGIWWISKHYWISAVSFSLIRKTDVWMIELYPQTRHSIERYFRKMRNDLFYHANIHLFVMTLLFIFLEMLYRPVTLR